MKSNKIRNIQLILDLFRIHGKVSQSFLAQHTGLQASTVSNLCRELRLLGAVQIEGKGNTTPEGGRPSESLILNPQFPPSPSQKISLAQGALYYLQVTQRLRQQAVCAFYLDLEQQNVQAAFSMMGGALVTGHHGQAGRLPEFPWNSQDLPHVLQSTIIQATHLLNPALLGICGPVVEQKPEWWSSFIASIQSHVAPVALWTSAPVTAATLGATWLSQDLFFKEPFHDRAPQ